MSDRKKTAAVEKAATHKVSITDRAKILFTDRAVPQVSSSAIRRVTAVEMPLVAKVDANIYTDKMRVYSPIPSAPIADESHIRKNIPIERKTRAVTVKTAAFFINFPVCNLFTHLFEIFVIKGGDGIPRLLVGVAGHA